MMISSKLILATVLLLLSVISLSNGQSNNTSTYTISRDFVNAVDYAMSQLSTDTEFQKGMNDLGMIFSSPACSALPYSRASIPNAPATLNLPRTSPLVLCYENDALLNWPAVHELSGRIFIRILNTKYNKDIQYTFMKVNTTTLGYFNTLKSLVDSGSCDIAIASTNLDTDRLPKVHFNCPYGSSSPGFLRSSLNNDTVIINTESDIDAANVTVLTYKGSSYDTYAKAKYKKATVISVSSGYTECFDMILKKQAHVLLGDATDMATWLSKNKEACGASCFTKVYGDPFSFGSFLTNNIRESNAVQVSNGILNNLMVVFGILLIIFTSL